MSINIGIVGLPNVGKSTLFNALAAAFAESANFPFCTIEPNMGSVPVPDVRLEQLSQIYQSKKIIPTSLEFVDIAGLVKGAAKGEGLGNQFLAHIRQVDAIAQVVRCFEDGDVVHVDGSVDPLRDVEVIDTELGLRDIETVGKRLEKTQKFTKATGKQGELARLEVTLLNQMLEHLNQGNPARTLGGPDAMAPLLKELCLLTAKPILWIANVAEEHAKDPQESTHYVKLAQLAQTRQIPLLAIAAGIEAELAQLSDTDRLAYLASMGLQEPGLPQVIRAGYQLLGLITFFTAGPQETRAWTIRHNTLAPQAAGVIHSDFERGFIRAEVMHCNDLVQFKSETMVRQAGKLRLEGKDYVVQDGDVIHFRFNV